MNKKTKFIETFIKEGTALYMLVFRSTSSFDAFNVFF